MSWFLRNASCSSILSNFCGNVKGIIMSNQNTSSLISNNLLVKNFHQTAQLNCLQHRSRVRVVDNSPIGKQAMAEGKPPMIIHVYKTHSMKRGRMGTIGDLVLVTIKHEMKKAIVVGVRKDQKPNIPRFDSNNVVLIEDNGTPIGTRIHVPIPIILRKLLKEKTHAKKPDYTKILSIATRFV